MCVSKQQLGPPNRMLFNRRMSAVQLIFIGMFILFSLFLIMNGFQNLGFSRLTVLFLVIISIFGSFINIPLIKLKNQNSEIGFNHLELSFFGLEQPVNYSIHPQETHILVNFGGAIIPLLLSVYLIAINVSSAIFFLFGIFVVSILTYPAAKPMKGLGIAMPFFLSPMIATLNGVFFATVIGDFTLAPALAYVAGTMGTLIGADVLHYKDIANLGAPKASIGGAGTWDGIFLTGIIASLLSVLPFL